MVKPEWGIKRQCNSCGAAFYDLRRDPIVCPKCGTVFDPEAILKSRRARPAAVEKEVAPAIIEDAEIVVDADDLIEVEDEDAEIVADGAEEEDPDLIEDASELGEDEDDMAEVIENIEDEDER